MSDGYGPSGHDDGQNIQVQQDDPDAPQLRPPRLQRSRHQLLRRVRLRHRQVVLIDQVIEVHDLETVEADHDGRLELVEYDNVHYEHMQQLVQLDDLGQHTEAVQASHDGISQIDTDQPHRPAAA